MITTGGAAISAATMERVQREFCANIYNGYGMTEASLTLLLHPRDALAKLGSCGKPTLISECRIVANDLQRDVARQLKEPPRASRGAHRSRSAGDGRLLGKARRKRSQIA